MDTKKFLVFGMILLGIFAMVNSAAGINITAWQITPSFANTTVQNSFDSSRGTLFNASICAGIGDNTNITNLNITLPSGLSFVSGSNGSNVTATTNFTNTTDTLVWTGAVIGNTTAGTSVCQSFWFNATVGFSGDTSITFTVNATNGSGTRVYNTSTINVDNFGIKGINWTITSSYQNTTVQNTASGSSVMFNLTYDVNPSVFNGQSITNVNVTLPSGFSYVASSANSTNGLATFSNTTNTLVWVNTTGGLLNNTLRNITNFWFNITISLSGDSSVTLIVNSSTDAGGTYINTSAINVDNINFTRAMFTTINTIDVYFTDNISTANFSNFVSNQSSWVATAATVDNVDARIVHLTIENLSDTSHTGGTVNDLNISGNAVTDIVTGFNLESALNGNPIVRTFVKNFYTKSSTGSRYGYGADNALTNRSLLVNKTNNITLLINTDAVSSFSYNIRGQNATTLLWDNITTSCTGEPSSSSSFDLQIQSSATNFPLTALSNSTTNYTVMVYVYNATGCSGTYQLLELNNWRDIYSINVDTTAATLGSTRSMSVYVKNESGAVNSFVNVSGIDDDLGNYPKNGYQISLGSTLTASIRPRTAGNLTIRIVNDASGNIPEQSGILASSAKIITVNPKEGTLNVVLTSTPSNIFKYFNTNITINVTLLNESITGFTSYRNITYNATITAGGINVSNTTDGVNITTSSFAYGVSNNSLENLNGTKVGSGNVSIKVNVLLDVNRDGVWDYNTTKTNAGTAQDAAALNIASITPDPKVIFAGVPTAITVDVKNQSSQIVVANVTLTGTTYFYNGSTTTAITTITNSSGGQATFTVIPEQNGTITVTVSAGGLTSTTTSVNVTGSIVARVNISPALGTKLIFNTSYIVEVPVRKATGVQDTNANVSISTGAGFVVVGGIGNNISALYPDGIGALFRFALVPTSTGFLNLTVRGSDGFNATIINAYEVAYQRGYTILPTYAGAAVTTLTAGLNNTINITIRNTSNNVLQGGNLTITYYNASGTQLSTGSVGLVSNSTGITTVAPSTATTAMLEVTNTSTTASGNISLSVAVPTISVGNVLIMNSTSVLVNKNNPSNLVVINNTVINLTFTLNAPYAEGLTISLYKVNITSGVLSDGLSNPLAVNTSASVVQITTLVIGTNLTNGSGLNANAIYVLINNSNGVGWNLLNITVVEPTITTDKSAVPLNLNSTLIINVSAYNSGVSGLNVTVKNSTNSILATNITGSNGITQVSLIPNSTDTLYVWINDARTTKTISATSTLSITYSPSTVYTDTPLVLYVRPFGSTTELVTESYLSIQAPGATGSTLYPATDGTYTISSPVAGVYKITAEKTGWTTSASVYITVLSPASRANFTNVTPSVTSITVNVSSSFTVTVRNSTGGVSDVTVTLTGATTGSATTNASGVASFTATATSTGTITVTASKTNYNNMSTTITVSELSSFTSVTASPTSISVGTPTSITVTVAPALENVTIALSGAGISTSASTNASGIAAFANINATSSGTVTVTASKTGYNSISTTITAISLGASNLTVTASPSSITLGQVNVTVTITVINATSSENVSNANVSISGAGITAASALTVNGTATFTSVTPTSAGTITVTVTKSGYNDRSATIAVVTTTTTSTTTTSTTTTSTTTTSTTSTTTTSTTTTTLPACKGDANNDGVVSDFELLSYIDSWANGNVSDFDLLDAIDSWAKGSC